MMNDENFKKSSNILFLTHVGQPGGAEFVMLRLCKSVQTHCSVLHFQDGPLSLLLKENGISCATLPMPAAMAGVRRSGGVMGLLKAVPASLSMITALASRCRKADIIVAMSQKSFILTALAKPFSRRPIIWFMNDLVSSEHFSKALIFAMTKVFGKFANKIILNSQASLEAWKINGGPMDRTVVIYPGSDVESIKNQISDTSKIESYRKSFSSNSLPLIGIFGRISHWKGQDVFLRALSHLPDVNAVIVGDSFFGEDAYFQKLKEMVAQLHLENHVTFAGHIEDVPCAMAACDIVVHCSTQPEPFGLVIVEAMLAHVPVIVSDDGGAREIIMQDKTGLRTPPGNVDALAAAIDALLKDPARAKNMSEMAYDVAVQKFSNNAMIAAFKDIISELR